ncbi:hypothetical protein D3C76_847230 [compost metagenome]
MDQSQGVFGQVRGNAGVDELDLARLALEGCVQATPQNAEVAPGNQAGALLRTGELGEEAVAVIEFVDQGTTLAADLANSPLTAAVEQRQLVFIPTPFACQALE